jgi:hypothetical protein
MTYMVKGVELRLPLTTESIKDYVLEKPKPGSNEVEDLTYVLNLYRDVLRCIQLGAGHGKDLAIAALKIEETAAQDKLTEA